MTTRKQAPSVEMEENLNCKRRKLNEMDDDPSTVDSAAPKSSASCNDLNIDCLVQILSFLPVDDMNSLSLCSQRCREARNNESLDQTRTGTIELWRSADQTAISSLRDALTVADTVLSTNYTHLKVVIPYRYLPYTMYNRLPLLPPILSHVTRLDVCTPLRINETIPMIGSIDAGDDAEEVLKALTRQCLPNVQEVYICGGGIGGCWPDLDKALAGFCRHRPSVSRVSLQGCDLPGASEVFEVSELILDNCRLVAHEPNFNYMRGLLFKNPKLERLTMVNNTRLTHLYRDGFLNDLPPSGASTQRILMKLIRGHPSLRWFRSDLLSAEKVAILRQERPEITFIME